MTYEEFKRNVQKINSTRIHKVTNSVGVYSAYKWIRKNKWLNINKALTEHEFYSIIRSINNYLAEELIRGNEIKFPHRMGILEIRKYKAKIEYSNGVIKNNLPIDWDSTLKLWYEDEESFKNKVLIKLRERGIFKVLYNKSRANYINQSFYEFKINRDLKQRLKRKIKNNDIDAFNL